MAKAEIIAIRDVAADFARQTMVTHKEIQYTIDAKGPYLAYMPIEDFTPAKARAMVETRAKEWAQTTGALADQR